MNTRTLVKSEISDVLTIDSEINMAVCKSNAYEHQKDDIKEESVRSVGYLRVPRIQIRVRAYVDAVDAFHDLRY